MKAAYIQQTGPADSIQYGDLPQPEPRGSEVLVKVGAVAVNPVDTYIRGGAIAMIYQEPMASLNPSMTIGAQLIEVPMHHEGMGRRDAAAGGPPRSRTRPATPVRPGPTPGTGRPAGTSKAEAKQLSPHTDAPHARTSRDPP